MALGKDANATAMRRLRDRAEAMSQGRREALTVKNLEEASQLVEELRIHQFELQIQNDELHEIQKQLEESRQQLGDLYDFAPVGYATIDVNSLIAQANLKLAAMLGTDRRRLIGLHFNLFVDRMSQNDLYKGLREGNAVWSGELLLRKSNGTLFPVSIEMARIGGDVSSWRCAVTDITTRKAAEEAVRKAVALRASEDRYRGLAEQSIDGSFVANAEGRYIDANPAACEFLGYTLTELKALTVADVLADEELPRLPEQLQRLRSGEIVRNEWRFRRKDGSVVAG